MNSAAALCEVESAGEAGSEAEGWGLSKGGFGEKVS